MGLTEVGVRRMATFVAAAAILAVVSGAPLSETEIDSKMQQVISNADKTVKDGMAAETSAIVKLHGDAQTAKDGLTRDYNNRVKKLREDSETQLRSLSQKMRTQKQELEAKKQSVESAALDQIKSKTAEAQDDGR